MLGLERQEGRSACKTKQLWMVDFTLSVQPTMFNGLCLSFKAKFCWKMQQQHDMALTTKLEVHST